MMKPSQHSTWVSTLERMLGSPYFTAIITLFPEEKVIPKIHVVVFEE